MSEIPPDEWRPLRNADGLQEAAVLLNQLAAAADHVAILHHTAGDTQGPSYAANGWRLSGGQPIAAPWGQSLAFGRMALGESGTLITIWDHEGWRYLHAPGSSLVRFEIVDAMERAVQAIEFIFAPASPTPIQSV